MNIALLRVALSLSEINQLIHEFPQFLFLSFPDPAYEISPDHWARVEILFGDKLSPAELSHAHALKWIHSPHNSLGRICVPTLEKQGNILLTVTREESNLQIAEFVLGTVLAFEKNLFHWSEAAKNPSLLWGARWRQSMSTLKGKTFLQIGMDTAGREIAKKASENLLSVISIDKERNFHPHCRKNLSIQDLHSILPEADIVSVDLPRAPEFRSWFGLQELNLMKPDSVLILRGPSPLFDEQAHEAKDLIAKLKGALFDAPYQTPPPLSSPLWNIPNLIITPDVASRPKSKEGEAFRLFRSNLRDYIHDNFIDMKYLIDTSVIFSSDTF